MIYAILYSVAGLLLFVFFAGSIKESRKNRKDLKRHYTEEQRHINP